MVLRYLIVYHTKDLMVKHNSERPPKSKKRLWTGLASILSFLLAVLILALDSMVLYAGAINSAMGISTSGTKHAGNPEEAQYYPSEYGELNADNLQKLIEDTYRQSVVEQEEGSVLLRNENETLPLLENERHVTLFGHSVVQPLLKAASAGSKGYQSEYSIDLYEALTNEGFSINKTLYEAYQKSDTRRNTGSDRIDSDSMGSWSLGEEEISFYTQELQDSWKDDYNDAAIVMLTREGGEGTDLLMNTPENVSQLALSQNERDMLKMIQDSGKFNKTILLVNSAWPLELGELEAYGVDACLWIGLPGQRGFEGVARLLAGKANPSGHLPTTFAANSLSAPATVNANTNNGKWENLDTVLENISIAETEASFYSVQTEGIYVGYKYYETRYEDAILNQGNAVTEKGSSTGKAWNYTDEVVYPFGYGLSYTDFTQTLDKVEVGKDTIDVTVTVKNIGKIAGKSAVQVYAQTPYGEYEKENNVEKSAVQLLDFGKTDILEPGESETLTIQCDKYLLASYDYTKEKGYIMSQGDYYIAIGEDAHDALNNILAAKKAEGMVDTLGRDTTGNEKLAFVWKEQFDAEKYQNSPYTGKKVTNRFDDADINYWLDDAVTYLSRKDWDATYPVEAPKLSATEEMVQVLNGKYYKKPEDAPSVKAYKQGEDNGITLVEMKGVPYDDPQWEKFLNQMTIDEMATLLSDTSGTQEILSIQKPAIRVGDGPDGPGGKFDEELYGDGRDDVTFPCQMVLAASFNKELLKRRGELIGEEAMYLRMSQVWMPGTNLHRTPFSGRNYEYYSEDSMLTYLCTIPEIQGIEAKGVHAGPKHLVGNDQEENRHGIAVFFNEQAFREGSLRGFEGAFTKGGAMTVMQAFNRLGLVWCSASKALCTEVMVNEWGFIGQQETDSIYRGEGYRGDFASAIDAGSDTFCLEYEGRSANAIVKQIKKNDDGHLLGRLRESAHDYLYMVANSTAMNGYTEQSQVYTIIPGWRHLMRKIILGVALLDMCCLLLLTAAVWKEKKSVKIAMADEVEK